MTNLGMRPPPDPGDPYDPAFHDNVGSLPDEGETVGTDTVEEDLALEPDEKRNATDGYAPADDEG